MKITAYTPRQFADALGGLLPPGQAWQWPEGGTGDRLLVALGEEPARLVQDIQRVLDEAIELHRPGAAGWNITDYRRVAVAAISGVTEGQRKMFSVGSRVGERLWSNAVTDQNGAAATFQVPLLRVDHLMRPFRVGSRVGDRLWGTANRYLLKVGYYRSVVDPQILFDALNAFKQAHVVLWFEDITGAGGGFSGSN